MVIEQIYTECLAQGAYYIASQGEAVIIDPLRDTDTYLERANRDGATIKYIFETHFHADFVSGHLSLAQQTGATIIFGPQASPNFAAYIAKDEEEFVVGELTFKALHTPGHTLESTTFLLLDPNKQPYAIFTGDTLFIGDVGRPDLSQNEGKLTQEVLAGLAYDSLRNKIMTLPDAVWVYPAHGAGSACGKKMMKQTKDRLGNQKKQNYALRENMSKADFITEITRGLLPPPEYFPLNVKLNKEGCDALDLILSKGLRALTVDQFLTKANQTQALLLDVRTATEFAKAHIPNSIFVGLEGDFAPWVGKLIVDISQPILLIAPEGKEEETIIRLSRVGFDHCLGYLKGGLGAWTAAQKKTDTIPSISAKLFNTQYPENPLQVFDVRKASEYNVSHVKHSQNLPLSQIHANLHLFPASQPFYLHCAGGYRSMIAASICKARGIHHFTNIEDGYKGISKTNIPCA